MHFYSHSYPEVMALPLKTFWLMSGNIDRIMAQKDMRALTISVCGHVGGEAAKECRQQLIAETGVIVKTEEIHPSKIVHVRDEAGFADLKSMSLGML